MQQMNHSGQQMKIVYNKWNIPSDARNIVHDRRNIMYNRERESEREREREREHCVHPSERSVASTDVFW